MPLVSPGTCAEAKVVIEIDGENHAEPDQANCDTARSEWLEGRGYRVIQFTASQLEDDLAGWWRGSARPVWRRWVGLNRRIARVGMGQPLVL